MTTMQQLWGGETEKAVKQFQWRSGILARAWRAISTSRCSSEPSLIWSTASKRSRFGGLFARQVPRLPDVVLQVVQLQASLFIVLQQLPVVGPNGAGKSTLLKLLGEVLPRPSRQEDSAACILGPDSPQLAEEALEWIARTTTEESQ